MENFFRALAMFNASRAGGAIPLPWRNVNTNEAQPAQPAPIIFFGTPNPTRLIVESRDVATQTEVVMAHAATQCEELMELEASQPEGLLEMEGVVDDISAQPEEGNDDWLMNEQALCDFVNETNETNNRLESFAGGMRKKAEVPSLAGDQCNLSGMFCGRSAASAAAGSAAQGGLQNIGAEAGHGAQTPRPQGVDEERRMSTGVASSPAISENLMPWDQLRSARESSVLPTAGRGGGVRNMSSMFLGRSAASAAAGSAAQAGLQNIGAESGYRAQTSTPRGVDEGLLPWENPGAAVGGMKRGAEFSPTPTPKRKPGRPRKAKPTGIPCKLCGEPKADLVTVPCTHFYCKDCLQHWEKKGWKHCPACKSAYTTKAIETN